MSKKYCSFLLSSPLSIPVKLIFLKSTLQIHHSHLACIFITFSCCSLASRSNTCTYLVSCYLKKTSILGYLMAFKLKRRPINISCCRLACKNMSHILRFALRRLTTSATPYLNGFNIKIDHTYNLCCILCSKYFTGTFLLTFYSLSTFFIYLLVLFFLILKLYVPSL